MASGRGVARNQRLWLEDILLAGKVESENLEQTGLRIEKRETGVIVMNDALEGVDDTAEKFRELAAGDQQVVDFEENLKAVTLARELRLVGLGRFKIQGVIHGDGNLAGDALHELQLGASDALGNEAAETHGADAVLGGGERKDGEGADIVCAETLQEFGKTGFFVDVADDESLLRLPDPAGRIA